jgi:hypothetical protein
MGPGDNLCGADHTTVACAPLAYEQMTTAVELRAPQNRGDQQKRPPRDYQPKANHGGDDRNGHQSCQDPHYPEDQGNDPDNLRWSIKSHFFLLSGV